MLKTLFGSALLIAACSGCGSSGATAATNSSSGAGGGTSSAGTGGSGGASSGDTSTGSATSGSGGSGGSASSDSPWVPADYQLVFGDEFNEAELDTSKWWTRFVYDNGNLDHLNDEQQLYRESNNHVMTGSSIKLTARKVSDNGPKAINYESGMLRSKTIVKHGYFEARVKMPAGLGVWPAFWLNGEASPWPPEIDIFEFVNNGMEDKTNMLHTGVINHGAQGGDFLFTDPQFNQQWTFWTAPYAFPDDFHVVALLWDETSAATYVDGKMIVNRGYKWVHDDASDGGYAHVLLNLAIGGEWAGRHGIDDAAFPQGLEVDYVRVYQKTKDVSQSVIGKDLCPAGGGC
jgi:beta-glucanase (GH16 family)